MTYGLYSIVGDRKDNIDKSSKSTLKWGIVIGNAQVMKVMAK